MSQDHRSPLEAPRDASQTAGRFDLSNFNPDMVAYYETAGWEAYYARDWLRVFGLMVRLVESQFHIPFPRSFLAALYVVRASIAFVRQGQHGAARRHLERFYRMAAQANQHAFDPRRVAELELRYWVIHRELAGQDDKRAFVEVMAVLHAAIFGGTPEAMRPSAESRVAAANAVDRITSRRSTDPAADWRRVEGHLRQAYRLVKAAAGSPHAEPQSRGENVF